MPSFTRAMRDKLLEACGFHWQHISPAIFGALFQSVLNKAERRKKGAHYTSEKNILKVIGPLFLDDLKVEFERLKARRDTGRTNALNDFHSKLGALTFFDPACGCGNFLVIAYRELRDLEIALLREIFRDGQLVTDIGLYTKVNVNQFYGIEIDEFPARIAEVAMWMMDHIMNARLSAAFGESYLRIPLKASPNIRHGDALQIGWADVLPPDKCSYVFGNPPFVGAKQQSEAQRAQVRKIAALGGSGGTLDYVCAWFLKAGADVNCGELPSPRSCTQRGEGQGEGRQQTLAQAAAPHPSPLPAKGRGEGEGPRIAFVATNSITQGEQVAQLWPLLFERYGLEISFGHRTFEWLSDARGPAHVHCVIIGLTRRDDEPKEKRLFSYDDIAGDPVETRHAALSPYLFNAALLPSRYLVVSGRAENFAAVSRMFNGSVAADGGHLLLNGAEHVSLTSAHPELSDFVRPFVGGEDLIHDLQRSCLWLVDCPPQVMRSIPIVIDRLHRVRGTREASTKAATRLKANSPGLFTEDRQPRSGQYLALPRTSSERRHYLPMKFLPYTTIAANDLQIIPNASLYDFGVLSSKAHSAWTDITAGRLKSDIRYSARHTYNTFPWPDASDKQREKISGLAQAVLDARAAHPGSTLADLYDPDTMPPDLRKAHAALDKAVDQLYRRAPFASDRERVEHLFGLYERLIAGKT